MTVGKLGAMIPGHLKDAESEADRIRRGKPGRPKVDKSKAKYPWFKFWPDAWLSDTELTTCSMATQGIWINCLAMIHKEHHGGAITKSVAGYARMLRVSNAELLQAFDELANSGTAEISYIKVHPETGELLVDKPVDKLTEQVIKSNLSQLSQNNGQASFSNFVYVTVLSRRMAREQKQRDYDRLRKRQQRAK